MARFVNGSWKKLAGSWVWWTSFLVLLYALPMAVVNGALDIFLKFETGGSSGVEVKGDSMDKTYKGSIEVDSFNFGIENTVSIGSPSGGAGSGKAVFRSLQVIKAPDQATPALMQT